MASTVKTLEEQMMTLVVKKLISSKLSDQDLAQCYMR